MSRVSDGTALLPRELAARLTTLRHDLHRHPELAFQEERTAARLEAELRGVTGADPIRIAATGVAARIPGAGNGATVAIRGDIDALPIHEATGAPFSSEHDGVMHACGHDVHAAWTVGAAHLLARNPAPGDVVIVLQPAEEIGRGARRVIASGVLDGVRAIFGAHVDMRFDVGQVVAEPGPLAGSTDEFTIEVEGAGGHAARPHEARDPILAAAAIVTALQATLRRVLADGTPGVITVTTISAGNASNVIPECARLGGTVRATTPDTRRRLLDALAESAVSIASAHRVAARVHVTPGTPPIVNPRESIAWARAAVTSLLGADALKQLPEPNLGGEDFAFYLERMAGSFLRIGARGTGGEATPAHTPRFLPDDGAIAVGAAVLAETARRASAAL